MFRDSQNILEKSDKGFERCYTAAQVILGKMGFDWHEKE